MQRKILIFGFFVLLLFDCNKFNGTASRDSDFPGSTPEAQSMNALKLDTLLNDIGEGKKYPDVDGLLILRNGYLLAERYYHGYDEGTLHTVQSVTKSFTSALVGIAIEKGFIKDVNQKILDFFPDLDSIENLDGRKRNIRIEDLLTMRTGTDFHEHGFGSPNFELNRLAAGWDTYYLNRSMINDPGKGFNYDSGGVVLLSGILKNTTGKHADEFADKYLFEPLGITKRFWIKNSEGHPHTGGGLHLTLRGMAKLGQLYLRKGKWKGVQIVPEQWVDESFKLHVKFQLPEDHPYAGYGYYWWILKIDPKDETRGYIYTALGLWGQFIFVIPRYDMVVAVTSDARGQNEGHPIQFLYSHILPSVLDSENPQ